MRMSQPSALNVNDNRQSAVYNYAVVWVLPVYVLVRNSYQLSFRHRSEVGSTEQAISSFFKVSGRNKDLRELFFCRIDNVSIIWFFTKSFMTLHWFDFSFRSDWKFHNNWRLSFEWMPPFEFRSTSLTDTLLFAEHMCVVNVWNVHTIGRHSETSIAYDFCVQVLDTRNHHTLWLSVGVFVYMCSVLLFLDIPRISCCPCVDWCKCVRFVCDCIEMSFYHSVISS